MILALDIASRTGFAVGAADRAAPLTGVYDVTRGDVESMGPAFANFRDWLGSMISVHQPTLIVFEAPLAVHGGGIATTQATVRLLFGLATVAELVAEDRRIECMEANIQTVRKHFTGTARAKKADVLEKCRALGWDVRTHDAADAAAIWSLARNA